jgi:DNA-binding NarL/FixJ family response regulator
MSKINIAIADDNKQLRKAIKALFKTEPDVEIMLEADYESNIVQMYIIGVKSFIGKGDSTAELIKAIRTVHTSGAYMTDLATEIVQRHLAYKAKESNNCHLLEEDEKVLVKMTIEGLSSKQITLKINRSPRTVDKMRERLYYKFGISCK